MSRGRSERGRRDEAGTVPRPGRDTDPLCPAGHGDGGIGLCCREEFLRPGARRPAHGEEAVAGSQPVPAPPQGVTAVSPPLARALGTQRARRPRGWHGSCPVPTLLLLPFEPRGAGAAAGRTDGTALAPGVAMTAAWTPQGTSGDICPVAQGQGGAPVQGDERLGWVNGGQ